MSRRKYSINDNYFNKIDTEDKAYWLGFLYADGHNQITDHSIRIELSYIDHDHLEKINKSWNSNYPITIRTYDGNKKDTHVLRVISHQMSNDLENIGMIQNKTLFLTFPIIPEYLYRHFIRGYFDGDGCFYAGQNIGKNVRQYKVVIISTNDFCLSLQQIIKEKVGVNSHIYDAHNKNGITKDLYITGANNVYKFLNWIYDDASLYLDRKYEKYINAYSYLNNSLSA